MVETAVRVEMNAGQRRSAWDLPWTKRTRREDSTTDKRSEYIKRKPIF